MKKFNFFGGEVCQHLTIDQGQIQVKHYGSNCSHNFFYLYILIKKNTCLTKTSGVP